MSASFPQMLRLIGYLAVAVAILLKGPIGAVLPLAVLIVHSLMTRDRGLLRSLVWGIPLVLSLTAPYYFWINVQTDGRFFPAFFLHHNLDRGLGSADDLKVHPWWFYGPRWLVDFLPWSPLVLLAGWRLTRSGRWRADAEARYGLVWFTTVLAVLSLAGFKRSDYLLPAYPGAAMLLGCAAEGWYRLSARPRLLAGSFALLVLACLAGWLLFTGHVLPDAEPRRELATFAREIRGVAPQPAYISFFRAEPHALAFHLGPPLDTFLEWENLDTWAGRSRTHYIVMPPECAAEWPMHVSSGQLVEVLRTPKGHEQPLVLMRTGRPNRKPEGRGTPLTGQSSTAASPSAAALPPSR